MDLRGKNVVYIGGFGGIGYATCKKLMLKPIASLAILDIMEKPDFLSEIKRLNPAVNVFWLKIDLCNTASIEKALNTTVDRIKYIDVLVNGSGISNEKNVELCVSINLIGVIHTNLIAIPLMDKSLNGRGGVILNVASVLGIEPAPPSAIYSATKHGVVGFTRSLSDQFYYYRTGIKMMVMCPGLTITPILDGFLEHGLTFPYSINVKDKIADTKTQTADECAESMVKAIENAKNGAIWKADAGKLEEVAMALYWEPHND